MFQISIVTNTGTAAYERVLAFEEIFHANNIIIVKKIIFEEPYEAKQMVASNLLDEIKNSARSLH